MDVKTLCLGALTEGDKSGYEIKRCFEAAFSHFFVAGFGSIYPALAELSRSGLVSCENVEQEGRPDKKVYSLTPAGERSLVEELLITPPRHKVRSEFLVLMYFAHLLPPTRLAAIIDERIAEWELAVAEIEACATSDVHASPGMRFAAGYGRAVISAALAYLRGHKAGLVQEVAAQATLSAWRWRRLIAMSAHDRSARTSQRGDAAVGPPIGGGWMARHPLAWGAVLLAIAATAGGLGYYKYAEITAAIAAAEAFPEPREAVEAVHVRRGEWAASTRAVGTVVALRQVELRNELAGTVVEIGFASGDIVEAGQVLVRLDTSEERAALAAAQAEARLAKVVFERRDRLRSSDAVSALDLDRAREELAAANARVSSLEAGIAKKTLVAPFRARVGLTDLQPGAYLDEGTRIAMLQGVDHDAYVDFALPQDMAAAIRPGVSVSLSGHADPGRQRSGRDRRRGRQRRRHQSGRALPRDRERIWARSCARAPSSTSSRSRPRRSLRCWSR